MTSVVYTSGAYLLFIVFTAEWDKYIFSIFLPPKTADPRILLELWSNFWSKKWPIFFFFLNCARKTNPFFSKFVGDSADLKIIYLFLLQPKRPGLHNGIIRGCTKIQDNMCLRQGSGGACSCSSDFCNIASTQILNLQMITFSICLNMMVMKIS